MARIPDHELDRLKREVSLDRPAEAPGVKLDRRGADLHGLCPFHEDRDPSLVITPSKNLWHCLGACQAGGSVIDWVMKAEKRVKGCRSRFLRDKYPVLAGVIILACSSSKGRYRRTWSHAECCAARSSAADRRNCC